MTQDSHHMSPRKFGSRRWLIDDFAAPPAPKLRPQPPATSRVMAPPPRVHQSRLEQTRPIAPRSAVLPHRATHQQPTPEPIKQRPVAPVTVAVPHPRRRFFRRPSLLVTMASVVFVAGMAATFWTLKINSAVETQVNALSSSQTDGEAPPATDKPSGDDLSNYTVAANMPRYLSVEKLSVKARVRTMGTTKSGAVQAPSNVHDVGWYSGSSLPGIAGGAAFMDGHVSSWETNGVFKDLPKLVAGDEITVEMGDGRIFTYQVVKTEAMPVGNVDMSKALLPVTPGQGGLNLMTCHGDITPGTDEFTERFMVYTQQI